MCKAVWPGALANPFEVCYEPNVSWRTGHPQAGRNAALRAWPQRGSFGSSGRPQGSLVVRLGRFAFDGPDFECAPDISWRQQ